MSKTGNDHFNKFKVKSEKDLVSNETRIMKLDATAKPVIEQFQFGKLHRAGEGDYAATKSKFGPLAGTDEDRPARAQKDSRFSMNPLLREPLAIEEEERRAIEERVQQRVQAVKDEARAKAHEEGYQAGLVQGHEEAYRRFQSEAAERMSYFGNVIQEAENIKQEIFRANERFLMELIFKIGKMVALKEVSTDKDYLLRLARELVERIGVRENIRIRIHPDDAETIHRLKPELEAALGTLKNLSVEASNQRRGGCILETEWNAIDASLDTQLDGVYEALIGVKANRTEETPAASVSAPTSGENKS